MNRNKKIVVVSALGLVALMLTTGWGVLAGADWPPEPYQEYSRAGTWIVAGSDHVIMAVSPRDPAGVSSAVVTPVTGDPTLGGTFPDATSATSSFVTVIRTGPNTDHIRAVRYVIKAGTPRPTVLGIVVVEHPTTLVAPGEMEINEGGTISIYSGAADKDADGLPDVEELPLRVVPFPAGHATRI